MNAIQTRGLGIRNLVLYYLFHHMGDRAKSDGPNHDLWSQNQRPLATAKSVTVVFLRLPRPGDEPGIFWFLRDVSF